MQRRFQKLVQTYDQNGDGELNQKEEIMALQKAVKDGGHDALDTMLAGFLFGRMESQEDGKDNGKPNWKAYDRNYNGIAEADELEAMRAQGSK
jgi:Ca2+-binding EF-hand superfamily protein